MEMCTLPNSYVLVSSVNSPPSEATEVWKRGKGRLWRPSVNCENRYGGGLGKMLRISRSGLLSDTWHLERPSQTTKHSSCASSIPQLLTCLFIAGAMLSIQQSSQRSPAFAGS